MVVLNRYSNLIAKFMLKNKLLSGTAELIRSSYTHEKDLKYSSKCTC